MSRDEFPPITLQAMPTLADALGVSVPPPFDGARRVHRIGKPGEDEQPAPPREAEMPSGVYPRKPRANGAAAVTESTTTEDKPAPRRKKPGPKKTAKKRTVPVVQLSNRRDGRATFVVNDLGAMSILAGDVRIELEPTDVKRLEAFLAASKGLRK